MHGLGRVFEDVAMAGGSLGHERAVEDEPAQAGWRPVALETALLCAIVAASIVTGLVP